MSTREQNCGVSAKRLQAQAFRNIASAQDHLRKIAERYSEVDNSLSVGADYIVRELDEFRERVAETTEWLREEAE